MEWWRRIMVAPVKKALGAVAGRVKPHSPKKNGGRGILKLREDVKSCEYRDVQVMWDMLRRSEIAAALASESETSHSHHQTIHR